MLKSCTYCGGVHQRSFVCPNKPKRHEGRVTNADKFRWSSKWTAKSKQIKQRDKYLCQVCLRNLYNTTLQYNFHNLETHHIVPIIHAWELRLEDDNLITLCSGHHKMAESGYIPKEELEAIAKASNGN